MWREEDGGDTWIKGIGKRGERDLGRGRGRGYGDAMEAIDGRESYTGILRDKECVFLTPFICFAYCSFFFVFLSNQTLRTTRGSICEFRKFKKRTRQVACFRFLLTCSFSRNLN